MDSLPHQGQEDLALGQQDMPYNQSKIYLIILNNIQTLCTVQNSGILLADASALMAYNYA